MEKYRLKTDQLAWRCDPSQFEFETTTDLEGLEATIGQDRALTAIEFGLGIKDDNFNIFILGEPGTGRTSTIKKILQNRAAKEGVPPDWCYVHDFRDGSRPCSLRLPPGMGKAFEKDVEDLVAVLREEIPKVFESKDYEQRKGEISSRYQEKNKAHFQELEQEANAAGFLVQRTVSGLALIPTKDGEPLSQEQYENLSDPDKADIDSRGSKLQERLNDVLRQIREREKEMRKAVLEAEKEVLADAIDHFFEDLEKKYRKIGCILEHLKNCKRDIPDRIDEFRPSEGPQIHLPGMQAASQEPSFDRYRVNLFLDNSELEGAPVVFETNPTYFNLFGRIEHVIQMGNAVTNFLMIKPGALHRAHGGYLVLDCREVLMNLFSYEALKRAIRNQEIKIEDMTEQFRLIATLTLKPQPIPLDCKIILIGSSMFYYLLFQYDPDFRKYFKVKADFDRQMKNTWENVQQYARFIAAKCHEENLLHFDREAAARMVEYSARLIEDKNRLSSRFLAIADLIREAGFYARQQKRDRVGRQHVELAIEAKTYRSNKLEEYIQEMIEEGTLLVDTDGEVTGQVNGLSVYMLGDYAFGKPSRVTVRTYLGKGGVVNIEREAKLSGPIHDKGVLILSGFLGDRFAQDKPLSLTVSICFEQSYSGVEGDSASSTELYALFSSLSGLPLAQGIAVTGSVNQRGQIQPIGGVNEKVEGFFAVCKAKGLTGRQGVIIPEPNIKNLMLKREVVDAVDKGEFHLWAVATVDQGIEVLTGKEAGARKEDGAWPEGTVNFLVDKRLRELAEASRKFGQGKNEEGKANS